MPTLTPTFFSTKATTSKNTPDDSESLTSLQNFKPIDDSTDVAIDSNLVLVFDSESDDDSGPIVKPGTGNILIKQVATVAGTEDTVFATIAASSNRVKITAGGRIVTINPENDLLPGRSYYVQIDNGAFTDGTGIPLEGINDPTSFNFTTKTSDTLPPSEPVPIPEQPSSLPRTFGSRFAAARDISFNCGRGGKTLIGTSKPDKLVGTKDNDTITLLNNGDRGLGLAGSDRINGGNGDDLIQGGKGSDRLRGGAGNDRILGGSGNDILVGDLGADTLTGGKGQDSFNGMTTPTNEFDTILDFTIGDDVLNLQTILTQKIYSGSSALAQFQKYVQFEQTSGGTLVKVDADGKGAGTAMAPVALLVGVASSDLTASSFVI